MNILVTGGAGYIGSHACMRLAAAGFTPVAYDDLSQGHAEAVQWGALVVGDVADTTTLRQALQDYQIEAVMHFAASSLVAESMRDPAKYYRNNAVATLGMLELLHELNISKFVFSSTAATYGIPEKMPISETDVQTPINPYGMSKLFIEKMLADFNRAYGLHYAVLRYFNVAGADPEGRIGEQHHPETHLIPLVIQAALGQRGELKVFGTDYATRDGSAIRDYVHVVDLVDAHILALQKLNDKPIVVNLGSENGYSVLEVMHTAQEVMQRPVPHSHAPRRAGDPPILVADADRAKHVLGWQPQYDLADCIRHAYQFFAKHI